MSVITEAANSRVRTQTLPDNANSKCRTPAANRKLDRTLAEPRTLVIHKLRQVVHSDDQREASQGGNRAEL